MRDGTTATRRQTLALAALASVLAATVSVGAGVLPAAVPGAGPSPSTPDVPAVTDQVRGLHAEGVVGENVTIAVVDSTGFDVGHPALAGRVAAAQSFADGEGIGNGGDDDHGTAAAAVVARTAPAAELYLASFDTADGFVAAINWAVAEGVDVLVAPVGFYGKYGDGSARVARAAAAAAHSGVVVVAPAGNLGRNHWRGVFAPEGGVHQFPGGPRNYLLGDAERASLWLSWPEGPPDGPYALELHRVTGEGSRLVARSQPFAGDGVANERIVADVDPSGTYFVTVTGPESAAGASLAVASPTHSLQYRRRGRSVVAPATAEPVVAVGAFRRDSAGVAPYSSAGPVDGRPGVDVVAPGNLSVSGRERRFVGSSAAAAYVAGVAALVLDAEPSLSVATVEGVLRTTARDVGSPGVDAESGTGLVRPRLAVQRGRNATQSGL